MAEFKCYECDGNVRTGEKFTFTKKGPVHVDCFLSSKRKEISDEQKENLRVLSLLLDSELDHLLNILSIQNTSEELKEQIRLKYKDIEKAAGETTRLIYELS